MENVFLVGVHVKKSGTKPQDSQNSLDELGRLVETAGGVVGGRTLQSLDSPSPATLIGKGKVEELRQTVLREKFKSVVFDEELKPAQQKKLAELIPAKILDRTRLILDIFAKRARTREGILQVELAQLSYMLPRMTERYGRFEQQVGGIGTRGPGERKLEVEARHIRDRVSHLKKQIDSVRLHREIARERRHAVPLPVITIVGYTDAGKSTLLNKLVELYGEKTEPIYADNKLFATLDPTTRRIRMPSGRWALFTDTVGFIDKLPLNLIAAFRSTLEETLDADILVHLIDATDKNMERHVRTVFDILDSLAPQKRHDAGKVLTAFNKTDLLSRSEKLKLENRPLFPGKDGPDDAGSAPVHLSAALGTGVNRLLSLIEEKLSGGMMETDVFVPFKKSAMLASLYRLGKVEEVTHKKSGVYLHLKLEKSHWDRLKKILHEGK